MSRVILASSSQIRGQILTQAGLDFKTIVKPVDEAAIKIAMQNEGANIRDIADKLAETKAKRVSQNRAGLVIGADQILEYKGEMFDKPVSLDAARQRLLTLRGQQHRLVGALVICENGLPVWRNISISKLTMRDFSDKFLDSYIESEGKALLGSVGAYRLEGPGVQLFSKIDGSFFAILGLNLIPLLDYLRQRQALLS